MKAKEKKFTTTKYPARTGKKKKEPFFAGYFVVGKLFFGVICSRENFFSGYFVVGKLFSGYFVVGKLFFGLLCSRKPFLGVFCSRKTFFRGIF